MSASSGFTTKTSHMKANGKRWHYRPVLKNSLYLTMQVTQQKTSLLPEVDRVSLGFLPLRFLLKMPPMKKKKPDSTNYWLQRKEKKARKKRLFCHLFYSIVNCLINNNYIYLHCSHFHSSKKILIRFHCRKEEPTKIAPPPPMGGFLSN